MQRGGLGGERVAEKAVTAAASPNKTPGVELHAMYLRRVQKNSRIVFSVMVPNALAILVRSVAALTVNW